ncbi:hypothetical protein ACFOOM_12395 [Streptomyces echinoruber]|uniref:Uncharacterized protein n=1 Tax=Streptomyces echinoruber TaxID=68898 RepID=A0A918RLI5_9ACTN|nr:hypothetical protein [Streptomyces echinoruber]GHA01112.1 hypothetical protein GCM10010389_45550 [Streptomyces echinoruber]
MTKPTFPRVFVAQRDEDVSGVSGEGVIVEGVMFSDGWVVTHWLDQPPMHEPKTDVWHNKGSRPFERIHGHGGSTRILWADEVEAARRELAADIIEAFDVPGWVGGPDAEREVLRRQVERAIQAVQDGQAAPVEVGDERIVQAVMPIVDQLLKQRDRARAAAGRAYKLADRWEAAHGSSAFLVRVAGAELRDELDGEQPAPSTSATEHTRTSACEGVTGTRGLLEHVGIDTCGRDITVDGRVVDPAPTGGGQDDDPPVQCWHTEPGSPCDWNVCRQPERLAAGDRGTDPADRAQAVRTIAHHVPTEAYTGWTDQAPADDEDAQRTARRTSMRTLLDRAEHRLIDTLGVSGAALLRQHVETEIRDADQARALAAQAQDLLGVAHETSNRAEKERAAAVAELERMRGLLTAENKRANDAIDREEAADRARAEAQRDRDQHAVTLAEVLRHFTEHGHPGEPCVRTGWIQTETVDRWRAVIAPTVERPWWKQLADAVAELEQTQAVIDRVREVAERWAPQLLPRSEAHRLLTDLRDALQQPTTEQ